ncbi:MAG TPA: sugar phosphate nucleotidyltransferase [Actinomycetota bacterium]|nr:sugar phosphate nucleotidyltransferase [Actinomycetota bacterium]
MNLACLVLAAGLGTRLRPLTDLRPKPLCPVNNVPLVDANLARGARHAESVAVNVHHHRDRMVAHLEGRAHLSVEPEPLGTAGALGNLREWIDGRDVLVINADAWHADSLDDLVRGWDRERPRLLVVEDRSRPDFHGRYRYTGACVLPARVAFRLPSEFSGLYAEVFAREPIDLCPSAEPFFDCGTIRDYHAANLHASGGRTVAGEGARILGRAERCVLWPGVTVGPDEYLTDAIRAADDVTVSAR